MKFVYKENYFPFRLFHFLEHSLQPVLELASVFSASHKRPHIQSQQCLILQAFRDITVGNSLRQSLRYSCFSHSGFTNEDRVIFGPPREDLHKSSDLIIPTNDGVQFTFSGLFCYIASKPL